MSAHTAEKILEAAASLFAERGYAATTTRLIAERASVNEVTIFRRFGNKLGVLKALGERFAVQSMSHGIPALPDPENTRETLLGVAHTEIRSSVENGAVALRLAFDATSVPEVAALVGEGPRANLETLAGYIAERQKAGDIRGDIAPLVIAEAFSSLTSSYVMYRMIMGFLDTTEDLASDETVDQMFDLFWSGAAPRRDV